METTHILIDTTIFVDHLRKRNKRNSILYHLIDTCALHTATMVEFELFAGATDQRKQQDVHDILRLCQRIPLTSEIAQQAAVIYQALKQKNEIIEIRDMIIASTAIHADVPIMTLPRDCFAATESWGQDVYVIPEYCFATNVGGSDISLSQEHTEFRWVSYKQACSLVKWDSNRNAVWELNERLKKGIPEQPDRTRLW